MRCEPYGPSTAKIAIVGEAPGETEALLGIPFVGRSGKFLTSLLLTAGIDKSRCYLTNVFMDRPAGNKINNFCSSKIIVSNEYLALRDELVAKYPDFPWPEKYTWEKVEQGKYVNADKLFELPRLKAELEALRPNLVLALGAKALWALTGQCTIMKHRGAIAESSLLPGQKILPTYHPAYVMRNWSGKVFLLADLEKAKHEGEFPEIVRVAQFIHIRPTLEDLWAFYDEYIAPCKDLKTDIFLAYDIETEKRQVTCISFAPSPTRAIVVPFLDHTKPGWSYWDTIADELEALRFTRTCLATSREKVTQNGMYDMQYCWKIYHMAIANAYQDTMLLHHALQPESPKDLGTLGSLYTNNPSWKIMRKRSKDRGAKREE